MIFIREKSLEEGVSSYQGVRQKQKIDKKKNTAHCILMSNTTRFSLILCVFDGLALKLSY